MRLGLSRAAAIAIVAVSLSACATPAPEGQLIGDPFEPLNRDIHEFNVGMDQVLLRPVSQIYDAVTPELGKHLIGNAVDHLRLPLIFVNNLLQGDAAAAGETLGRFVANSAFGLGVLDPATEMGLPLQPTDFGLTLASWGVNEGPYLVLPLLGPSTGRDAPARVVDFAADPVNFVGLPGGALVTAAQVGVPVVHDRARNAELIDSVLYESEDSYVTLRSIYVQSRRRAAAGGDTPVDQLPDVLAE